MKEYDTIIIGAGASGYMASISALSNGKTVAVLEFADKPLRKVKVSGGGRCNFTNLNMSADHYLSGNPHFVKSALSQFSQELFLDKLKNNNIPFYEKKLGQLFCKSSSNDIINLLQKESKKADFIYNTQIKEVKKDNLFVIKTNKGIFSAKSLIIATGAISYPALQTSNFAEIVAKQFDINFYPLAPALVPLQIKNVFADLSGVSIKNVKTKIGKNSFVDDLLFTHKGLSGPAVLKISSYWKHNQEIEIDFLPFKNISEILRRERENGNKSYFNKILYQYLPKKFIDWLIKDFTVILASEISNKLCDEISNKIHRFKIVPNKTAGFELAEVCRGGINTQELSSKTMESKKISGLFFCGECLDITGELGGYNIWWAFASGYVAGKNS